jgi:hypothetical protein
LRARCMRCVFASRKGVIRPHGLRSMPVVPIA